MEFVVRRAAEQKDREEATEVMLHVHQKGVGVCGVYTYEIAETKVTQPTAGFQRVIQRAVIHVQSSAAK
jgi:ATP-dependent Clp protease adapter protein ClpS